MKGESMWKSICLVCFCCCLLLALSVSSFAGDKEELAWKARALVAEYQMKQQAFTQAQTDLQAFLKELDTKGFMYKDGVIVEKPKPPEKKAEPPKPGK